MTDREHPLILIDGVCNLCHGAANFIIDRDPAGIFRFASLQSSIGQKACQKFGFDPAEMNSLILIEDGTPYRRSTAALQIARRLSFPWNLCWVGIVIPRFLRDGLYDIIAQRRYRWFGKTDTCRLPTPERKARFVDGVGT